MRFDASPVHHTTPPMKTNATTRKEYLDALDALDQEPIIGTHRIGALVITAGTQAWSVAAGKHFKVSGRAITGMGMRTAIAKAVKSYVKLQTIY